MGFDTNEYDKLFFHREFLLYFFFKKLKIEIKAKPGVNTALAVFKESHSSVSQATAQIFYIAARAWCF